MENTTRQDLVTKIARIQSVYDSPSTSDELKKTLKYGLDGAKKALDAMDAAAKEVKQAEVVEQVAHKDVVIAKAKAATQKKKAKTPAAKKEIEKKVVDPVIAKAKAAVEKTKNAKEKLVPAKVQAKKATKSLTSLVAAKPALQKIYAGTSETDLIRDAARKAMSPGKRKSASGKTYYEKRSNRVDVGHKKAPYLEKGGSVSYPDKLMGAVNKSNINIRTSNGTIEMDPKTGAATKIIVDDGGDKYIAKIEKFDIEEYKKFYNVTELPNSIDILDLGYWMKDGTYEEPAFDWREEMAAGFEKGGKVKLGKVFYQQDNIGKAKYTISSHDGVQTHKDGSPFYGINIFHNKKDLADHRKKLISEGYTERNGIYEFGGALEDMTAKEMLDKQFSANVYTDEILLFEVKEQTFRDEDKATTFAASLRAQGFDVKKKKISFDGNSKFTVKGFKKKPITYLDINSDNPLSSQLVKITGDAWAVGDYKNITGIVGYNDNNLTTEYPFVHVKTGQVFKVNPKMEDGGQVNETIWLRVNGEPEATTYETFYAENTAEDVDPLPDEDFETIKNLKPGESWEIGGAGGGTVVRLSGPDDEAGLPKRELLIDENRGIYIPQFFYNNFDFSKFNLKKEDFADLSSPDNEFYQEAWDELLADARMDDGSTLEQDGDLWLVSGDGPDKEQQYHAEVREWMKNNAPAEYQNVSLDEIPIDVFNDIQQTEYRALLDRFDNDTFKQGGKLSGYDLNVNSSDTRYVNVHGTFEEKPIITLVNKTSFHNSVYNSNESWYNVAVNGAEWTGSKVEYRERDKKYSLTLYSYSDRISEKLKMIYDSLPDLKQAISKALLGESYEGHGMVGKGMHHVSVRIPSNATFAAGGEMPQDKKGGLLDPLTYVDGSPVRFEVKEDGGKYQIFKKDTGKAVTNNLVFHHTKNQNSFSSVEDATKSLRELLIGLHTEIPEHNPAPSFYKAPGILSRIGAMFFEHGGNLSADQVEEVLTEYIAAALWSTINSDTDNTFSEDNFTREDIAPATLRAMEADVRKFLAENADALKESELDNGQIGHDLWLTRNGHGAGFWDRGLDDGTADLLTDAAKAMKQIDLEAGDDGKVHYFPEPNFENGGKVDQTFDYRMLDRLRSDCDYYLGNNGKSRHEKHLWAGNVDGQIKEMKRLWNGLKVKPEWLSMEEIEEYEKKMKAEFAKDGDISGKPKTKDEFYKAAVAYLKKYYYLDPIEMDMTDTDHPRSDSAFDDGQTPEEFVDEFAEKYDLEKYYNKGGQVDRGISRDRKFKSQESHEQRYQRKTIPKNPHYKEKGGSINDMLKDAGIVDEIYPKILDGLIKEGYLKEDTPFGQFSSGGGFEHFAIKRPDGHWLIMNANETGVVLSQGKHKDFNGLYDEFWDDEKQDNIKYIMIDTDDYSKQRPVGEIVSDIMNDKWKKAGFEDEEAPEPKEKKPNPVVAKAKAAMAKKPTKKAGKKKK